MVYDYVYVHAYVNKRWIGCWSAPATPSMRIQSSVSAVRTTRLSVTTIGTVVHYSAYAIIWILLNSFVKFTFHGSGIYTLTPPIRKSASFGFNPPRFNFSRTCFSLGYLLLTY